MRKSKKWKNEKKYKGNMKRGVSLCIAIAVLVSVAGCGSTDADNNLSTSTENKKSESSIIQEKNTDKENDYEVIEPQINNELTEQQYNAINMLNYLTVLTQEINDSNESRLYLESVYSSLISNIYPNAVDTKTETQMINMLDMLEKYRMIDVKRERLEYIYEQNKAQAIKSAIPDPMALLSMVESGSALKAVASGIYMAVDSVSSYKSAKAQTDLEYLNDGWELDDAEANELHESRKSTFTYMIDMVRDNSLPGDYALSEKAVKEFVEWKNKTNFASKIQWFENKKETYAQFGPYWLELAKSYYNTGKYEKCLNSITEYEKISTRIFRKDYEYAEVLPIAMIAAKEVKEQSTYVKLANKYAEKIIENTDDDDWTLRYFVAQIYVDLYRETQDKTYINKSYDIVLNNVNVLVENQKKLNKIYLEDVQKKEVPDGATDQQKKDIKNYNKLLKDKRKKELPPVDKALYLNCDMLFALAEKLNISLQEQDKINSILHEGGEKLFLIDVLDEKFKYNTEKSNVDDYDITFKGKELRIPVSDIAECSALQVKINGKEKINDWKVSKVKRSKGTDCSDFVAIFKSKKARKYKYKDKDKITVQITPVEGSKEDKIKVNYIAVATKKAFVLKAIKFREE